MAWPEIASPYERRSLTSGLRVRDESGAMLGYVALIGQEHLYARRWPFSRHWTAYPLSRVRHVSRDTVLLEGEMPGHVVAADKSAHAEIPTQTLPLAVLDGTEHADSEARVDAPPVETETAPH
ncbi:hypothetical protein A176_000064 [Myxococcus hansupus]|uniref:Uncharacterized protein n=1 Tax=Pseudomyxococcus hansupus TaxID=1297742 RepID=A0A0H4X5J2_9BACT|nr:hypothetical protein [Myxococcus hansupus]AKQ63152.1 hypothetical protein A176_000064 [Myxococcus hansupus]